MSGRLQAAILTLMIASAPACGGSSGPEAAPTPCSSPIPVATDRLPRRLQLESFGVVTKVESRAGYTGAEFVTEESVIELYPRLVRELGERGYTFVGGDNEGFEAELAFLDHRLRNVSFSVRQGCGKQNIGRVLMQEGTVE